MKKQLFFTILFISIYANLLSQEAKVISDCTVLYKVSVEGAKADSQVLRAMRGTTKVLYIKGSKSRTDLVTPRFKQTTIFDSRSDSTIILRELGNAKYLSYLSYNKRKERNKQYEEIEFEKTNEMKLILGYECVKVVAKLKNGSTFNVYYASAVVPSNKEYEYQFRDLPGLVLEYEAETEGGKTKITYTASQITLTPVPVAKFDIPTPGYRVL